MRVEINDTIYNFNNVNYYYKRVENLLNEKVYGLCLVYETMIQVIKCKSNEELNELYDRVNQIMNVEK